MRKILPLICLLALFAAMPLQAAIAISSRFEPASLAVGDYGRFIINVEGSSKSRMDATLPTVDGLVFSDKPSVASQVSIVNGDVTSYVQFAYSVRATKPGPMTVPAFSVKIDGKTCTVPTATLNATTPGKETSDALLIEVDAPDSLYAGQSAQATLTILVRGDLALAQGINPVRSGDGIMQEPINPALAKNERTFRGTTTYNAIIVPLNITPLNAGKQTLAYDLEAQVRVPRRQTNRISDLNDPMEEMMRNMQSHAFDQMNSDIRAVNGHGETVIDVKPLPENAPASFDGAVGNFAVTGTLSSHKTKVGEPVELTVVIQAQGNLKQINAPKPDQSDDWRPYPPTEDSKSDDPIGLSGTKTFKYLFSPMRAGTLTTPALRFSWLDPQTGKYVEKTLGGEKVEVADVPGMNAAYTSPNQPTANPTAKASAKAANNDNFHPISLLDTSPSPNALVPPHKQKIFLFAQLIPAILLAWAVIVPLRRRRAERDPLAKPRRIYTKAAASAKEKALQAVRKNDTSAFFANARSCLQNSFCANDPNRRPETVSAADVVQILGDDSLIRRDINLLFNGSEAMRYGAVNLPLSELNTKLSEISAKLGVK